MSYRQAAAMMREFLPVGDKVNHGTIRNRTLRVGARIDKIVVPQTLVPMNRTSTDWTMAIDGGFVHGRSRGGNGNFELLVGRLKASGVKLYVFAWVRGQVESTVLRISTLATTQSGASRPRLTVITDGANSLQSIYRHLPFPTHPILDWFHISMRVRYLEQIAGGLMARSDTERATKRLLIGYLDKLRWCGQPISTAMAESAVNQV